MTETQVSIEFNGNGGARLRIVHECGHEYRSAMMFNADPAGIAMAERHGRTMLEKCKCATCGAVRGVGGDRR